MIIDNPWKILLGAIIPGGLLIFTSYAGNLLPRVILPIFFLFGAISAPIALLIFFIKRKDTSFVVGLSLGLTIEVILLGFTGFQATKTIRQELAAPQQSSQQTALPAPVAD